MECKLSNENIVKLINLYRSHQLLWDMNSKSYRRNDLKNKAYDGIAQEMGMMVDVVKKKIRNLRTTYTNEKRKMTLKKSGSGAEEQYMTSLPWYSEMSFLDKSIVIRKSMDNSAEESIDDVESFEEIEGFQEYCGNEAPRKRPKKSTSKEKENIDVVLEKLMQENVTEFTAFGASVAQQLTQMRKEPAYQVMGEIQNLICQKKIEEVRRNRFRPISVVSKPSGSSNICTSTPSSDILSLALTDAEIEFDSE